MKSIKDEQSGRFNIPKEVDKFRNEIKQLKERAKVSGIDITQNTNYQINKNYTLPFIENFHNNIIGSKSIRGIFSILGVNVFSNPLIDESVNIIVNEITKEVIDEEELIERTGKIADKAPAPWRLIGDIDLLMKPEHDDREIIVGELKISVGKNNSLMKHGIKQQKKTMIQVRKYLKRRFSHIKDLKVKFVVISINPQYFYANGVINNFVSYQEEEEENTTLVGRLTNYDNHYNLNNENDIVLIREELELERLQGRLDAISKQIHSIRYTILNMNDSQKEQSIIQIEKELLEEKKRIVIKHAQLKKVVNVKTHGGSKKINIVFNKKQEQPMVGK